MSVNKKIISIISLFFLIIPFSNASNLENNIDNNSTLENNLWLKAKVIFKKFSLRKNPEKKSKIFGVLNFWDNLQILKFLNDDWLKVEVLSWKKINTIWYIKKRALKIENMSIAKNIKIKDTIYTASSEEDEITNFFTNLLSDKTQEEQPEYMIQEPITQEPEYNSYEQSEYLTQEIEYNNYSSNEPEYINYDQPEHLTLEESNSNISEITNEIYKIYDEDEKVWKYKPKKWIDQFNFYDYMFWWQNNNSF